MTSYDTRVARVSRRKDSMKSGYPRFCGWKSDREVFVRIEGGQARGSIVQLAIWSRMLYNIGDLSISVGDSDCYCISGNSAELSAPNHPTTCILLYASWQRRRHVRSTKTSAALFHIFKSSPKSCMAFTWKFLECRLCVELIHTICVKADERSIPL